MNIIGMKLDVLLEDFKRCNIQPDISRLPFANWRSLPREGGCYSIWQGDVCIYVGKAGGGQGIRGRFTHHEAKAFGEDHSGTTHPEAWVQYRDNYENWEPSQWEIEFFEVNSAVHRTYLEGAMMLMLDPLCNDENFSDRQVL